MKKILTALAVVGAAIGLVLAAPLAAQAHDKAASITCSSWSVSLTNYDSGATAEVVLDGATLQSGTFGGSYVQSGTLTSDAAHPSHELKLTVRSNDGSQYNLDFDQSATGCYTAPPPPPVDVCLNIDGAQATIPDGLVSDGNGGCVTPPVPPQACVVGAPYHEGDDNLGATGDDGITIRSQGDGKATDGGGYAVTGNAQGITGIDWTQKDVVGNGIFFRLIFDLSADGGSAYNSFSGLGTHVDQSTVAGYGSKAVFAGKSLADVAATWPHNKLAAIIWQTGSSYAAGDGAVLTGYSGACGEKSFVVVPPVVTPPTDTPAPPAVPATELSTVPVLAETGTDVPAWVWITALAVAALGALLATAGRVREVLENRRRRSIQQ